MSVAPVMDCFVLLGDSLTQRSWQTGGLAQKLAQAYVRRMDIVNRGHSGYNSEWGIPIFEQIFRKKPDNGLAPKCKLLTIWFGANDAVLPGKLQYVPIEKFKENLNWFINSIRSVSSEYYSPHTRILLFTPPPISVERWGHELSLRDPPQEQNRNWETTKAYADAVKEVASKSDGGGKIPLVDVWDVIWKAAGEQTEALDMFLEDGLHLTKEGYEVSVALRNDYELTFGTINGHKLVYNEMINVLTREYPELHCDNLPFVFPPWDRVDEKNSKASVISQYVDV